MISNATYDELLDAVERLSPEAQADFIAVLQRRLAEKGRQRVVADVREGTREFERGGARPTTADDRMDEIES